MLLDSIWPGHFYDGPEAFFGMFKIKDHDYQFDYEDPTKLLFDEAGRVPEPSRGPHRWMGRRIAGRVAQQTQLLGEFDLLFPTFLRKRIDVAFFTRRGYLL